MRTYHLGEEVRIGRVEGRLTGINTEDPSSPYIKIDSVNFPLSEFRGVTIEPTKDDLSVRVMKEAERSTH